jgi:plastocyanin
MKRMITLAAAVLTAAAIAANAGAGTTATKLVASVSDPVNISLKLGGKKVTKLKAGKYTISVKDTSTAHNFRLVGPGVNKTTSVTAKTSTTWTVTLKKGKYTYVCDPHKSFMKGTFTVS